MFDLTSVCHFRDELRGCGEDARLISLLPPEQNNRNRDPSSPPRRAAPFKVRDAKCRVSKDRLSNPEN